MTAAAPLRDTVATTDDNACLFTVGDRVLAPGTPGAQDKAHREGGPGIVTGITITPKPTQPDVLQTWCWVRLLDPAASEMPQPFRPAELRLQPTV